MGVRNSYLGFMSPFVWMFISSYEKLRNFFIKEHTITTLVQLEYSGFDGATVPICTFALKKGNEESFKGGYIRLSDFRGSEKQGPKTLEAIKNPDCGWFFRAKAFDFSKIPGSPIAYSLPTVLLDLFVNGHLIKNHVDAKSGQNTGDNNRFIRFWFEVSYSNIGFGIDKLEDTECDFPKWYPYNKGGEFRKWYGNFENVINWEHNGKEIKDYARERNNGGHWSRYIQNLDYMLREGITWTFISSSYFGARYTPPGHLFDYAGCSAFPKNGNLKKYIGYFCSGIAQYILKFMNPTLNLQPGNVSNLPEPEFQPQMISALESDVDQLIELSKESWDAMEKSWNYKRNPLITGKTKTESLSSLYKLLCIEWELKIQKAFKLEIRNKQRFIDVFNLNGIVSSEINPTEITLDYNPYYHYGDNKSNKELEMLLLNETIQGLVSYTVGCIFGRYSLDKDSLILANTGEGLEDYLKQIPEPTFMPDKSGILPITDENDFTDDLPNQFITFLKVSFGTENFSENLRFVEEAIGKGIRSYFIKDFYKDHVKRYKKRPIYWMISSPTGAFRALIYLHRYTKDTIGVFLNDYLRQYQRKLDSKIKLAEQTIISGSASSSDKTKAQKDMDTIHKVLKELETWERDVVYPLALKRVELDLDDGVKVNYGKLGAVLERVKGLNG
jgi:type II restriction/modification system DNA methylase subunit YeeA